MKKYLPQIVIGVAVLHIGYQLAVHREIFTRPYRHQFVAELYSQSQYVVGSGSAGIGDDGLYAFAGYYYIRGGDPSQVNFEHPPLGKYLIGASEVIFGNENIIYIFYVAGLALGMYALTYHIHKKKLVAAISVLWLSLMHIVVIQYIPTSRDQLSVTLLDLPQTLFFMWGIYFFLKADKYWSSYLISAFFFGLAFSTKFFPILIVMVPVFTLYQWRFRPKSLPKYLVSLTLLPLVYLGSYAAYFYYHPSLTEFINFQRYVVGWRIGNPWVLGNLARTIFTGSYISWWDGSRIADREWTPALPALVFLALIGGLAVLGEKEKNKLFLGSLCLLFIVYLAVGTVGVARYLLPVLPLLIVLALEPVLAIIRNIHPHLYARYFK